MRVRHFCTTVIISLAIAVPTSAQVTTAVPNIYANTDGTGVSNILIGPTGNPWSVELIWNANQLTGLIGSEITSVKYRQSSAAPGGYPLTTTTWSDYRISFGASVAPSAASTTLASNFLVSPTLVRSGPLTVGPNAWPAGDIPRSGASRSCSTSRTCTRAGTWRCWSINPAATIRVRATLCSIPRRAVRRDMEPTTKWWPAIRSMPRLAS